MHLTDVHTHLTHEKFSQDLDQVISRARETGLGSIVVNGLEPDSNREIVKMADSHPDIIVPAWGIYPVNAVAHLLPDDYPYEVPAFCTDTEIQEIKLAAERGDIAAVGECGLDGYAVDTGTFPEQIRVFESLLHVAKENDIPVIIHSRKLEKLTLETVEAAGNTKVIFHCYCGKTKWAIQMAEKHGWAFSIPANARKNGNFIKLLEKLPITSVLTETDAPYLAPTRGERNEPMHVQGTVTFLAELREWTFEEARAKVWENYERLFDRWIKKQK